MSAILIFEKPYIRILHDAENGILFQTWQGFCRSKEFRNAIDFSMNFLEEKGLYRIISDVREQRIVSPGDQDYVKEKVARFIQKNGRFKMAFVVVGNSIPATCVKRYDKTITKEISEELNRMFATVAEAREWILHE